MERFREKAFAEVWGLREGGQVLKKRPHTKKASKYKETKVRASFVPSSKVKELKGKKVKIRIYILRTGKLANAGTNPCLAMALTIGANAPEEGPPPGSVAAPGFHHAWFGGNEEKEQESAHKKKLRKRI